MDVKELVCTGSTVFSDDMDVKELVCTGSTVFSDDMDVKELVRFKIKGLTACFACGD